MPTSSRGRVGFAFGSIVAAVLFAQSISLAQYKGAQAAPKAYKAGFDSITIADAKSWLAYLAGPETEGRGTGEPGFQKAAEYMAAQFKSFGLKPAGDAGTYFQNVQFYRSRVRPEISYLAVDGVKVPMTGNFSMSSGLNATMEADVVAIAAATPDDKLEDATALKDKIVIVTTPVSDSLRFAINRSGASAVFTIGETGAHPNDWNVRRSKDAGTRRARATSGTITKAALDRLASMLDLRLDALSDGGAAVTITKAARKLELVLRVQDEPVMVPNVLAVLPGSDPKLKNEVVGLGCHLDHLGIENGVVHPGADDDGSGSTALLAVAKAFSKNKVKPKRSILFMAFCGEEMGLLGSAFQSDNPVFPLDKMVCELQMDMVGRNEEHGDEKAADNVQTIHLVGSKRISTDLHELVLNMNKHVGFTFEYDEEDVYSRSDHAMFARKGVPIAFVFSGFHPDYHRPTDTIEKINFEKIVNTSKLFYLVAASAADAPQKLRREVRGG